MLARRYFFQLFGISQDPLSFPLSLYPSSPLSRPSSEAGFPSSYFANWTVGTYYRPRRLVSHEMQNTLGSLEK